jgi:O-antigen/teichoic acid export membrane protein
MVLASVPGLVLQTYLQLLVQANYEFTLTNIAWLLGPLVNVLVNGVLVAGGWATVGAVVVVWIVGQLLGTTLLVVHLLRKPGGLGPVDLGLARWSLAFGIRSHPGRVMQTGNYRLDQWILGAVGGRQQLGLYSVAVAWAETLFYLPTSLVTAQRPDLVRATREEAVDRTMRGFRVALFLTLAFGAALFALAPWLVDGIFGHEFHGAVLDLRILIAGAFGVAASKVFSSGLTAQRLPLLSSAGISVALVGTVVLDALLIPRFGDRGASVASSIAYTLGGASLVAIFLRALGGHLSDLVPTRADLRVVSQLAHRIRRP